MKKINQKFLIKILGASFLFTGVALLVHISAKVSLQLALLVSTSIFIAVIFFIWKRSNTDNRKKIISLLKAGIIAGILATIAYDVSKHFLSQLDNSPFNPFHAIKIFGQLLVGTESPGWLVYFAGIGFHLFNGVAFGIVFCFLFRKYGIIGGILWGLFLEFFQLSMYPGWLDIKFLDEFRQISVLGHVVYGAVLGLTINLYFKYKPLL